MPSSDSSSSSSERDPTPPPPTHLKDQKSPKKKAAGKNATNWAYTPPPGVTLLQDTGDAGEFDWDAVADDDENEIWLIRVPDSIKPKYLENTTLQVHDAGAGAVGKKRKSARVGVLKRKHATFDIWSMGDASASDANASANANDDESIGGEEIKSLSCLLSRKSKQGTLYPAPRPITRHLIISAQPATPDPNPNSAAALLRPPRERHPREALTHTFMPYGSFTPASAGAGAGGAMDVDVDVDAGVGVGEDAGVRESPAQRRKTARGTGKGKGKGESAPGEKRVKVANKAKEVGGEAGDAMDVDVSPARGVSPRTRKTGGGSGGGEVVVEEKKGKGKGKTTTTTETAKGRKRKGEGVAASEKKSKKAKTA